MKQQWHAFALPFIGLILLLTLACGGIGLAYEHDLTQDYAVWATDLMTQAAVVQKDAQGGSGASSVVRPMVFSYGWNETFIIAKQHPNLDGFDEVETSVTHWFIIEVTSDTVHGPLTEDEYHRLYQRLGVPDDLDFTETVK
jgi:hypothetical protein